MVVIEGPRFSTRAESQWFAAQGWTLINMTGHPEAVLARELELCFATVALVTDLDAGVNVGEGVRAEDVFAEFARNIDPFKNLIRAIVSVDYHRHDAASDRGRHARTAQFEERAAVGRGPPQRRIRRVER